MKVLLNVSVLVADRARLNAVADRFRAEGFEVVDRELDPAQIDVASLEDLIVSTRAQYGEDCRLVILSNVTTYTIAWYRIWNHLCPEFVLLMDVESPAFLAPANEGLVLQLASFKGLDEDTLTGRIYVDIDQTTAPKLHATLRLPGAARCFASLDALDFDATTCAGTRVTRRYAVDGVTYEVGTPTSALVRDINLDARSGSLGFSNELYYQGEPVIMAHALMALFLLPHLNTEQRMRLTESFAYAMRQHSKEGRRSFADVLDVHLRGSELTLGVKTELAFAATKWMREEELLESFGAALEAEAADDPLGLNALFVHYHIAHVHGVPPYPAYWRHQREVLDACVAHDRNAVASTVAAKPIRGKDRVLLLLGEVTGMSNGYVRAALDLAAGLRDANWSVGLAITERHLLDSGECSVATSTTSNRSEAELRARATALGADLLLAQAEWPRLPRTMAMLSEIREWEPTVVVSVGDTCDLTRAFVFSDYPTIEWSLYGAPHAVNRSDITLSEYTPTATDADGDTVVDETVEFYARRLPLPSAFGRHQRITHRIPEDAFVVLVPADRLSAVHYDDGEAALLRILRQRSDVHVILAGDTVPTALPKLEYRFGARVHALPPADDLAGLAAICDAALCLSANDDSGFMALAAGLPVVVFDDPRQPLGAVLEGHGWVTNADEIVATMLELIDDPSQRSALAANQAARLKKRNDDGAGAIETMVEWFSVAEQRFLARSK